MSVVSPHTLTVGTTGTGKTTLLMSMAAGWMRRRRMGVVVCDPKKDDRWRCDRLVTDSGTMLALAQAATLCHLVIDESGRMIGRYEPALEWFTTEARGKPWFHATHLIAQSPKQLHPNVRTQVGTYNVFPIYGEEFETVAREMLAPQVVELGPKLKIKPGKWAEFLRVQKWQPIRLLRLDYATGRVSEV